MELVKILLTLKILILCAAKLGECMKCYRCVHKKGDATFPPSVLPTTVADNAQCDDPFNKSNNKVPVTRCEGHCVKKIYKFEDTKFYERDCVSSCEDFSERKVGDIDNVKVEQSCCDEDKCNSATTKSLYIYLLFISLLILLVSFRSS